MYNAGNRTRSAAASINYVISVWSAHARLRAFSILFFFSIRAPLPSSNGFGRQNPFKSYAAVKTPARSPNACMYGKRCTIIECVQYARILRVQY